MSRSELQPIDTAAAGKLWDEYRTSRPDEVKAAPEYTVERFGDNARLADALVLLVLSGQKRATADLVSEFIAREDRLPQIGGHWVVCDSSGAPRFILRTTELRIGTLTSVDASFAHDEGEDEQTRDGWLREHRRYFARVTEARGATWSEEADEVIFERFAVVWPPQFAD